MNLQIQDKSRLFDNMLVKNTSIFKGMLRKQYRSKPNIDIDDIFQDISLSIWEKYSDQYCDFDIKSAAAIFCGYIKNDFMWRAHSRKAPFSVFSDLTYNVNPHFSFSDTLIHDDSTEERKSDLLKYNFLSNSFNELEPSVKTFAVSYLKNDCNIPKTAVELNRGNDSTRLIYKVMIASLKSKIKQPELIELLPPAASKIKVTVNNEPFEVSLKKAYSIKSRTLSERTQYTYQYAIRFFTSAMFNSFNNPSIALSKITSEMYNTILAKYYSAISAGTLKIITVPIKEMIDILVGEGLIKENLFYIALCKFKNVPVVKREGKNDRLNFVKECLAKGMTNMQIHPAAREKFGPNVQSSILNIITQLRAESGESKEQKTSREIIVSQIASWLADPSFYIENQKLHIYVSNHFNVTHRMAFDYLRAAKQRVGIETGGIGRPLKSKKSDIPTLKNLKEKEPDKSITAKIIPLFHKRNSNDQKRRSAK